MSQGVSWSTRHPHGPLRLVGAIDGSRGRHVPSLPRPSKHYCLENNLGRRCMYKGAPRYRHRTMWTNSILTNTLAAECLQESFPVQGFIKMPPWGPVTGVGPLMVTEAKTWISSETPSPLLHCLLTRTASQSGQT